MIKARSLLVFVVGTILAVPTVLNADPVKKATTLTFSQPIEIPGMVLEPGTYVIKVPDPVTHDDMVGFFNTDESHLYKLVRTIPAYRVNTTEDTAITLEERAGNAPRAIKTWFFPGDAWGKEFVYGNAETLAAVEQTPTLITPAPAAAEEAAPAPVAEEAAPEAVAEAPVEVAQAAPPAVEEAATAAVPEELPKTGSTLPLFALLGAASLALGGLLRWLPTHDTR